MRCVSERGGGEEEEGGEGGAYDVMVYQAFEGMAFCLVEFGRDALHFWQVWHLRMSSVRNIKCSKNTFSKQYQCSKNTFSKQYQYSKNEFSKQYQYSKNEFIKRMSEQ
jgi:hypothetical protein